MHLRLRGRPDWRPLSVRRRGGVNNCQQFVREILKELLGIASLMLRSMLAHEPRYAKILRFARRLHLSRRRPGACQPRAALWREAGIDYVPMPRVRARRDDRSAADIAGAIDLKLVRYSQDEAFACPECGGDIAIIYRSPHPARPRYEKQQIECTRCMYSRRRVVDDAERPLH